MSETSAPDRILDAFERLVLDHGERSATISATADAAGVSKGGLLYHFGSKASLVDGLAARLDRFGEVEEVRLSAEADPVATFLRESVACDQPVDRTFIALLRLSQLDEHAAARVAIDRLDEHYVAAISAAVLDPQLALLIVRLSDGIYLRTALGGSEAFEPAIIEGIIAKLATMVGQAS